MDGFRASTNKRPMNDIGVRVDFPQALPEKSTLTPMFQRHTRIKPERHQAIRMLARS